MATIIKIIRSENPEKLTDSQCDLYPNLSLQMTVLFCPHLEQHSRAFERHSLSYCHIKGTASSKQERTYFQDCWTGILIQNRSTEGDLSLPKGNQSQGNRVPLVIKGFLNISGVIKLWFRVHESYETPYKSLLYLHFSKLGPINFNQRFHDYPKMGWEMSFANCNLCWIYSCSFSTSKSNPCFLLINTPLCCLM